MVILVVGAVVVPQTLSSLRLAADPLNIFIKLHHEQCGANPCSIPSMIPDVFAVGEPRVEVERRLHDAGFGARGDGYLRDGADAIFPACSIDYYVRTTFDSDDHLTTATGQTMAVCM